MKKSTIAIAFAALMLALATTGCDLLLGEKVTEEERLDAFLADANATTRDYDSMRSHFHSTMDDYANLNQESYWVATSGLAPDDALIEISGLTSGGEIGGIPLTSSLSGTITTSNLTSGQPITIGFLADETNPRDMRIRIILIDDGTIAEVRSIR